MDFKKKNKIKIKISARQEGCFHVQQPIPRRSSCRQLPVITFTKIK